MIHGWYWINEGFRYFTFSKYMWISTVFTLIFTVMLLLYIAPIFQFSLIILLPIVTAGLGLACYQIERGNHLNVSYLVKGFVHTQSINLIRYGFWLILLMILAQLIGSIFLGALGVSQEVIANELLVLSKSTSPSLQSIMSSDVLTKYLMVTLVMMLPVTAINLFSPYILVFSKLTALQAIRLSFSAVLKNISALLLYALIYLLLISICYLLIKFLDVILVSVFSQESVFASMVNFIARMVSIVFIASLSYCSAYVAFKDVFLGEEI